jgi:hypothetical protein
MRAIFCFNPSCPFRVQIVTCISQEFQNFYHNEGLLTEALSDDVLRNVIHPNKTRLRARHAAEKRYVAFCLRIAHQKGEDGSQK